MRGSLGGALGPALILAPLLLRRFRCLRARLFRLATIKHLCGQVSRTFRFNSGWARQAPLRWPREGGCTAWRCPDRRRSPAPWPAQHAFASDSRTFGQKWMEDFTHLQQRTDTAVSSPCPEHRLALPRTRRQPPREAHDRRTQRQRRLRSARIALPPLPCCRLERPSKHLHPTDVSKHITSQRRVVQPEQ